MAKHTDFNGITVMHTGPLNVNSFAVSLGGPYVFLVDPASCEYSGDEEDFISYFTDNKKIPVAVILTHGHFDHVSSLPVLRAHFPEIKIAIHKKDSDYLGKHSVMQKQTLYDLGFSEFYDTVSDLPQADAFLCEDKTLFDCFAPFIDSIPAECHNALKEWKVIFTPGHTEGSVCLYNKSQKSLITGDTLFYQTWGRTDMCGGSEKEIRNSLSRLYKQVPGDTVVFPGHDEYGFLLSENDLNLN